MLNGLFNIVKVIFNNRYKLEVYREIPFRPLKTHKTQVYIDYTLSIKVRKMEDECWGWVVV